MASSSSPSSSKGITMADMLSPLYLHPSDGPHTGTIAEKLSGPSNYKAWKMDMELVLASKRKVGFVTGLVKRDKTDLEKQDQWDTCNSMIIAWLTGSMAPHVIDTVRHFRNAKEMWEQLERRYDPTSGTRKYKLNTSLYKLKQENMSISEYYSRMKCLWDEIESMKKYPPITETNPEINAYIDAIHADQEQDKLFQFLNGIDDEKYAAEKSHLLMFTPLPTVEVAYSRLVQEEAQRELSKEAREEFKTGAMFGKKEEWCYVCEIKGHTKERCWKVIGYPKWHPKGKKKDNPEKATGTGEGAKWNKFKKAQGKAQWSSNAQVVEEVNITSEQLEKLLKVASNNAKAGSQTEEEVDTSYADSENGFGIEVKKTRANTGSVSTESVEIAELTEISGSIKILTYNVWFREELEVYKRMQAIGELIQLHLPDIICLQEVTPNIYDILRSSSWWKKYSCSTSYEKAASGIYFCMQLAKLPVKSFSCKKFSYTAMGRELCVAEVEVNRNKSLVVATSHLESPCPGPPKWDQMYSKERVNQAKETINFLKEYPNAIFCGDMNWDDTRDGQFPIVEGWFDAWERLRPADIGFTYDTASNKMLTGNRKLQKRLDRFLCHLPDFEVRSIYIIGTEAIPGVTYSKQKKLKNKIQELTLPVLPSDHYGVLLTITNK